MTFGANWEYYFDRYFDNKGNNESHVVKTPDMLLLFCRHWNKKLKSHIWYVYWYCYDGDGNGAKEILKHIPYPLPYCAFARSLRGDKGYRIYKMKTIHRLLST